MTRHQDDAVSRLAQQLAAGRFVVTELADGSSVLLDAEGMRALCLNESATAVLGAVRAGTATPEALAEELVARYEVDAATASRDAVGWIDRLARDLVGDR